MSKYYCIQGTVFYSVLLLGLISQALLAEDRIRGKPIVDRTAVGLIGLNGIGAIVDWNIDF